MGKRLRIDFSKKILRNYRVSCGPWLPLLYSVTVGDPPTVGDPTVRKRDCRGPHNALFWPNFCFRFQRKKVLAENLNKQITVCFCHCGHFFLHLSSWAGGLGLERLLFNLYLGSTMKNTESHRKSETNRLTKPSHGEKTSHPFFKENTTKLLRFMLPIITSFI